MPIDTPSELCHAHHTGMAGSSPEENAVIWACAGNAHDLGEEIQCAFGEKDEEIKVVLYGSHSVVSLLSGQQLHRMLFTGHSVHWCRHHKAVSRCPLLAVFMIPYPKSNKTKHLTNEG